MNELEYLGTCVLTQSIDYVRSQVSPNVADKLGEYFYMYTKRCDRRSQLVLSATAQMTKVVKSRRGFEQNYAKCLEFHENYRAVLDSLKCDLVGENSWTFARAVMDNDRNYTNSYRTAELCFDEYKKAAGVYSLMLDKLQEGYPDEGFDMGNVEIPVEMFTHLWSEEEAPQNRAEAMETDEHLFTAEISDMHIRLDKLGGMMRQDIKLGSLARDAVLKEASKVAESPDCREKI